MQAMLNNKTSYFFALLLFWFCLPALANDQLLAEAFKNKQYNLQIAGQGKIIKILPDDNKGSRHQRFIIKLTTGQTLLIAHNIDLAPRVPNPILDSMIKFYGVYEWNKRGGVIHWTHHDPKGKHIGGWLEYQGRKYH